jgi:hypothetical protein
LVAVFLLLRPLFFVEHPAPITVAILPPSIDPPRQEGAPPWDVVDSFRISLALQRIGHRLPGVRILEAPLGDDWRRPGQAADLLRRLAVDEVIVCRILSHDNGWTADLSREGKQGEIWQRSSTVVAHPEQWPHALADSLWQAYGSPPRRPGLGARFEVEDAGLKRLFDISQAAEMAMGAEQWAPLVAEAETLRRREPQFFEAHLMAVESCLQLGRRRTTVEPTRSASTESASRGSVAVGCLDSARSALEAARLAAPGDLRTFSLGLQLALLTDDVEAIESALASLREVSPGDAELVLGDAAIAWWQGRRPRALAKLQRAVERQPSWELASALILYQQASGDVAAASAGLQQLEQRAGGHAMLTARWRALETEMDSLGGDP